jgi:hypothetical protein
MVMLVSHRLILDGDPLWAIATGKWIAVHHAVPAADPFSWTAWGKPWVCPEWGFDLLAYLLSSGYYGLILLTWTGLAGFYVFLWLLVQKEAKSSQAAVMVFTIAASLSGPFIMARPQVFSYFFFTAFMYILSCRKEWRWALPALTLLWANLHASVVLGVIMVGFEATIWFMFERDRSMLPVAGACFLASLANPKFLGLWSYTLWLSTNQWNRQAIEWRPPDFTSPVILYSYIAVFLTLGATLYLHDHGDKDKRRLTVLAVYLCTFAYQAITQVRFFPYLLVVWADALLWLMPESGSSVESSGLKRRWWIDGPLILAAAFALWYGATTFPGKNMASNLNGEMAPAGAVQYIESHGLTGRLFNEYTWGGYLIYKGIPAFIDGRDDVYLASTNVFQDYVQAMKLDVDPDMVLQKYGVKTVLLPNGAPLNRYLDAEPQKWKVSYRDKVAVVLRRQ